MYTASKYMGQNLVKSETLPNIALPKDRRVSSVHISTRIRRAYFRGVTSYRGGLLAKIREGFASFVTYITKLSDQCQKTLKVASPRTTVTGLHLCVRHSLRFLIAIFPARIFSKQCSLRNRRPMSSTSTAKPSTASRCPYRGHTMRVTRSWRWVAPSSSSATGTSALLSTTSAYAKGLSNVINPTTL